jgi:hypothetical protein
MTLSLTLRRRARAAILLSLTALALGACSDSTGPSKVVAGTLTLVPGLAPADITPDGVTALLGDFASPGGDVYYYNTVSNTLSTHSQAGSPDYDFATGISSTLSYTALHGKPVLAGVWTEGTGWNDLPNIYPTGCEYDNLTHEQDQGGAWDITADGHVVVGLLWNLCRGVAFYWDNSAGPGGFVQLDLLGASAPGDSSPPSNRATKIADNGSLIGGWAETPLVGRYPAIWYPSGAGVLLPSGTFTDDSPGEVLAVSADGSVVAGDWGWDGFYWSAADGVVNLGARPADALPDDRVVAKAVSAGGKLIFGTMGDPFFSTPQPFVWTKDKGIRTIAGILADNHIAVPAGISLTNLVAASADGSVLLGFGYDDAFQLQTWILHLPVAAYGI